MSLAPNPLLHYSDPEFIRISSSHPIQISYDRDGCKFQYRVFGGSDLEERLIFLPGMFETCSSSVYLLQKLACFGYGCISLDLVGYKLYSTFVRGFVRFCQQQNIKRVHLIGCDSGGFDALQIASFPEIEKQISILSIVLINSFTEPWLWDQTNFMFKVFKSFAAKTLLFQKIEKSGAIERQSVGAMFAAREVQAMQGADINARVQRIRGIRNAVNPCIEHKRIMSIEPLDGCLTPPEALMPSVAIQDVRVAVMKEGGDWPHIEEWSDVGEYVLAHVRAFSTEVPYLALVPKDEAAPSETAGDEGASVSATEAVAPNESEPESAKQEGAPGETECKNASPDVAVPDDDAQ